MNVENAMNNIRRSISPFPTGLVLYKEVKRLREQRELLYDAIPAGPTNVKEMYLISKEVEDGRQEKMTVDQAMSVVSDFNTATTEEKVLVAEIKRLRGIKYMKGEAIDELNAEVKRLREDNEDWCENRKKLGREIHNILKCYGV